MLSREALARRLREARRESALTLKQVEHLSGFSSTHVSEIERGRTTPTVDALVRIARALRRDPCYFIEDRPLLEIALVAEENQTAQPVLDGKAEYRSLTPGILGGRLEMGFLHASQPCSGSLPMIGPGFVCLQILSGRVRLRSGVAEYALSNEMSLHAHVKEPVGITVESAPANLLYVRDPEFASAGKGERE
jgi:transcriptional regulator with XRE-family HTH domain